MGLSWQQGPLAPGAYKGLCSYYDIGGDARLAAWSYPDPYPEVGRISNLVSFEPDIVAVHLDATQRHLEPGQTVVAHVRDRELTVAALRLANTDERAPGRGPEAPAIRATSDSGP